MMKYECHGHIILDGVSYSGAVSLHDSGVFESAVRENLRTCARQGIGFYRDGGDKHMVSAFAKRVADEYDIDYRTPIYIIHKKGHYGRLFGRHFEKMSEYRALVSEAKRLGADFIKIAASGILDFKDGKLAPGPALARAELIEMVRTARGEGFAVMAHVNGADNIKNALEAGASSIEHGFFPDNETLSMFAQTGAVWVPTCATISSLIGRGNFDGTVLERVLAAHKAAISKAYSMNVLIASGSDAGAVGVLQGAGTLDEYNILRGIGINPEPGNIKISELFAYGK